MSATAKTTKAASTPAVNNKTPEYGMVKSKDVPDCPKKIAVLKALKALGAIGAKNGVAASVVAAKVGVSSRDVRHYCYHAICSGLTEVHPVLENGGGYEYCITAKGIKYLSKK